MARIILIDDDAALRATLRRALERWGHAVREAHDGEMGSRLIRDEPPDLVITDILMPEKEGIETIQEVRAMAPDVGILAISGAGSEEEGGPLLDAAMFGANDTLSKPFSLEDLKGKVEAILGAS